MSSILFRLVGAVLWLAVALIPYAAGWALQTAVDAWQAGRADGKNRE